MTNNADDELVGFHIEDVQRKLREQPYAAINEVYSDMLAMTSPEHREAALLWLVMNLGYLLARIEKRLDALESRP
ncbi:MAG: hypothetical protein F4Z31_02780 [Gemmatimonadetes bacterium]|nr:hypothetical protein [Gemmatimonadota bacterium]MYE94928.1 hypothetical protein [Gemmatimonadota bacterium]MYJ12298.1 hypothetical protein [Gemmatimonadota bacterium]